MQTATSHKTSPRVRIRLVAIITAVFTLTAMTLVPVSPTATPANAATAADFFVDVDATGANNGSSWEDAFLNLQDALVVAVSGNEIWVAEGTYLPTTGTDRGVSFDLVDGVGIYGGFAGTETLRGERDWETHLTILSGDIGTVDDAADNSYRVLQSTGLGGGAVLDGFTVSAGNANGTFIDSYGGGMYNASSSPTLANLAFTDNTATSGGGMYNNGSSPTLTNVTFTSNTATSGGGMYNSGSASPTLTNVTFTGNTATTSGGGIYSGSSLSSAALTNVTFDNNTADYGAGMIIYWSSLTLTNVTFSNNIAAVSGGGILVGSSSSVLIW